MKMLVTGATGFVGRHLVDKLLEEGHKVTCYVKSDRLSTNHLCRLPVGILNNLNSRNSIKRYDIVYHIAGVLGKRGLPLSDYEDAHIRLPAYILKRMNFNQYFVYMSTGYTKYPTKPYQQTKVVGEQIVRTSGIPYTIIKPGFIYGAGDYHHLPLFKMINRLGSLCPIIGDGQNLICPTYIDDVIRYTVDPPCEEFYIAGKAITMDKFTAKIADALGVRKPSLHLPCPKNMPEFIRERVRADFFTDEIVFDCDLETTPIIFGLAQTVKWYRKEGIIK